ncbi:IucA/IucC family protein [Brevibacillus borstelensis]|uniref:IucA/IucC family protein n=1 Tax=Brevibacillus borstelensis TaxID=45462 RepID=UPI0030C3C053
MKHAEGIAFQKRPLEALWAEHAAIERVLNAYLRENGIFDPRVQPDQKQLSIPLAAGAMFRLDLTSTGVSLAGEMTFWSRGGQHAYGSSFYQATESSYRRIDGWQLIHFILEELSHLEKNEEIRLQKKSELLMHIQNSVQKTEGYLRHFLLRRQTRQPSSGFLSSEQSLFFGHPFHPTPKSSAGFAERDLHRFAPELGASFPLHYLTVSPELIAEEWMEHPEAGGAEACIPQPVREAAAAQADRGQKDYKLLPCHPWQARYLSSHEQLRGLFLEGKIADLGPMGDDVYPTSSVRTVWEPAHCCQFKLPLHVRITNFIRVNTREQIKRTMDAAKIVLQEKNAFHNERFRVLMEYGFRSISLPELPPSENDLLMQECAVVFRENPPELRYEDSPVFVVGSLMEAPPGETEPALFRAMRENDSRRLPDLADWFRQYLSISMLPVLSLFSETGVSLEAHAQNSLVRLESGWPVKLYVRDLEGISVDRETALGKGWVGTLVDADSPVLYSREQAWRRLQYYFFVNHLGYVARTLAKYGGQDESAFWSIARNTLLEQRKRPLSERMAGCIDALLHGKTMPAKANLVSIFQRRGESPLYVDIPNPIRC